MSLSALRTALAIAIALAMTLPAAALPVTPADRPELVELTIAGEEPPPLAELDVPSLRSWMNHTIGPGLSEEPRIDPGIWPLLQFQPTKALELRLDLQESP